LFSMYLSYFVTTTGREGCRLLFNAYLVAATLSAGIGLATRFGIMPSPEMFFHDEAGIRIQSTFKDPNVFGPFLVGACLIVLDRMLHETPHRALYTLLLFAFLINIVLTFSRDAFVHLFISVCLFIVVSAFLTLSAERVLLSILIMIACGGALLVAVSTLLSHFGLENFLARRLEWQSYDNNRFGNQMLGLQVFADYPLGIRSGEYNRGNFHIAAHNLYMRVLVENGILGALGLMFFLLASVAAMVQTIVAGAIACRGALVCVAVLVGALVESMVIDTLHWRHLFFFLGVGLGLSCWAVRQRDEYETVQDLEVRPR
jgi:O-antigen ligase